MSQTGTTMQDSSSVKNGRCDFYEPFGRTNSWRVLDADNNLIPNKGATYHVAVWLQENTSGKFGVAVGTWKEDFRTPYELVDPTCERDLGDFDEQHSEVAPECFPVVACPASPPISKTTCQARDDACGGVASEEDKAGTAAMSMSMGGCGGEQCPAALSLWAAANVKMHEGMALDFSGDLNLDFVRGMIPHHAGALAMCDVLMELQCVEYEDVSALDGMVHFCNHVKREQEIEMAGMGQWLAEHNMPAEAPCEEEEEEEESTGHGDHGDHGDHGGHRRRRGGGTDHSDHGGGGSMGGMFMGCGELEAAEAFVEANHRMHSGMTVSLTCDHTVDFVRAMIPHHKGAIAMCDVLGIEGRRRRSGATGGHDHGDGHHDEGGEAAEEEQAAPDPFLAELCANITRVQRAEIAWMSQWLSERGHAVDAPCGLTADGECPGGNGAPFGGVLPALPCENTLPTSSFCHTPDGRVNDAYCTCERVAEDHACGTSVAVDGVAILDMDLECARFCGLCPAEERPPLFPQVCPPVSAVAGGGCHSSGSFPYFCTEAAAVAASPQSSAHQDEDGGFWMPNGIASFHGDYSGDAKLCDCPSGGTGGCSGFGDTNGCAGGESCCSGTCRASTCAAWEVLGADSDGNTASSAANKVSTAVAGTAAFVAAVAATFF